MADAVDPAARIPAHIEVSGLIRRVQAEGGFAMVLAKGEPEAGTIMVVLAEKGANFRAFERMPQMDGSRVWSLSKAGSDSESRDFAEWLDRRRRQDSDLWIIELDVPEGERFIL